MESLIMASVAVAVTQRAYQVASSLYHTLPKSKGPIVIEITTTDGKTSSREAITPTASSTTSLLDSLSYHVHTIGLFTYSDAKTVLIPWVLFGIGHALSASFFGLALTPSTLSILIRAPQVAAWIYLNLIAATISNQRHPTSVLEDAVNKPWRPLPSKRISPNQALYLMVAAHIVAVLFSLRYGGTSPTIAIAILGYMYNDLGGSDNSWVSRHLLNGLAFISFGAGATEVALGRSISYPPLLAQWLRLIALVVATGVHAADMYDQEGDALAKRSTLPLVIGDNAGRWVLAISVLAWSLFCPYFWSLSIFGYILPVVCGAVVAKRTLTKRSVEADRKTYKLWNVWLIAIYCLPLTKVIGLSIAA